MRPYLSEEARNLDIINKAYLRAAEQIEDGSASAQVLTFFLKFGADYTKNKLELEKMEAETELAKAKVEALKEAKASGVLLGNVIKAMCRYRGDAEPSDEEIEQLVSSEYENIF